MIGPSKRVRKAARSDNKKVVSYQSVLISTITSAAMANTKMMALKLCRHSLFNDISLNRFSNVILEFPAGRGGEGGKRYRSSMVRQFDIGGRGRSANSISRLPISVGVHLIV
jgi:hypothetical protein